MQGIHLPATQYEAPQRRQNCCAAAHLGSSQRHVHSLSPPYTASVAAILADMMATVRNLLATDIAQRAAITLASVAPSGP